MNDEHQELSSAYLDGVATAAERAQVEADPELLAAVGELRAVRAALADREPPSAEARESAIAAALAEFDRSPADATGDGGEPDAVILTPPAKHRWRWSHLAGAAAAAAVILAGGVAILRDDAEAPTAEEGAPVITEAARRAAPADDDEGAEADDDADDAPAMDEVAAPEAPAEAEQPEDAGEVEEVRGAEHEADEVEPMAAPDDGDAPTDGADEADEVDDAEAQAPDEQLDAAPAPPGAPAPTAEEAGALPAQAWTDTAVGELRRVESGDDLLAVASTLEAEPPTLGALRIECEPDGGVARPPDVLVTADGDRDPDESDIVYAVVVALPGDRYGAVDVATCALVLVSPRTDG